MTLLRPVLMWPLLAALALAGALVLASSAQAAPGGPNPYAGGTPAAPGKYDFVAGHPHARRARRRVLLHRHPG